MGIFNKKDKDGNFAPIARHIAGLPNYTNTDAVCITVRQDVRSLVFKDKTSFKKEKMNDITLSFDKIIGADFITQEELAKASTIGRAVIGGILFGGVGAVVGAISANGNQKTKKKNFFAISYMADSGEEKTLLFDEKFEGSFKLKKVINDMCKKDTNDDRVVVTEL